jgi:hypothetical protein
METHEYRHKQIHLSQVFARLLHSLLNNMNKVLKIK